MAEDKLLLNTFEQVRVRKITKLLIEYKFLSNINSESRERSYNIIKSYIYKYYRDKSIQDINESFFEKFFTTFFPLCVVGMDIKGYKAVADELFSFADYLESVNNTSSLKEKCQNVYRDNLQDIRRVGYVTKEIKKYGEMPVISRNPFIIDMACYKNMKKQESRPSKYIVYNQGYFYIEDKLGTNIILGKQGSQRERFKIKINLELSAWMMIGDIAHMRLKRKMFSTAWNIIDVKAYYSQKASEYL